MEVLARGKVFTGRSMGASRPTFGRIVEAARRKVADAVPNGKVLRLAGALAES
jgi:predicted DNA-binding protein (UPF0251 family)